MRNVSNNIPPLSSRWGWYNGKYINNMLPLGVCVCVCWHSWAGKTRAREESTLAELCRGCNSLPTLDITKSPLLSCGWGWNMYKLAASCYTSDDKLHPEISIMGELYTWMYKHTSHLYYIPWKEALMSYHRKLDQFLGPPSCSVCSAWALWCNDSWMRKDFVGDFF